MAVQKKKTKPVKNKTPKPPVFKWTPQRKRAALLLSEGTNNYEDVAAIVGVNERTLYDWRQSDIFLKEVDRLTLENEKATKAGLVRLALKAMKEKEDKLKEDKNTVLDWAEFLSDIQSIKTQKHEINANIKGELEGARELLAGRIAGIASRLRTNELLEKPDE